MEAKTKRYGLFIPKKNKPGPIKGTNIFGDDSDEDTGQSGVNNKILKEADRSKVKKQTQMEIDKALAENPNVYEYDNIYDDLMAEKTKNDVRLSQKSDKKPKYIEGLLKMAEIRKREEERRTERKVQKERQEEGDEFEDKEQFVTAAYKKKMLEMQEAEEKEKQEAAMEAMLDVTKQKDLSGFYRYIYRQTAGGEDDKNKKDNSTEVKVKKEKVSGSEESDSEHDVGDTDRNRIQNSSRTKQSASESPPPSRDKKRHRSRSSSRERSHRSKPRRSSSREHERDKHREKRQERTRSERKRDRSRSRDRERERSREKKRNRSRSRDRERERSRERKKDRSRSKDRGRERSREGSASHEYHRSHESHRKKKERSRSRDNHKKKRERSRSRDRKPEKGHLPKASFSPDRDDERNSKKDIEKNASAESTDKNVQTGDTKSSKEEEAKNLEAVLKSKYARHTTDDAASEARKRYLARKLAKQGVQPAIDNSQE